jgi:hypothetical protein
MMIECELLNAVRTPSAECSLKVPYLKRHRLHSCYLQLRCLQQRCLNQQNVSSQKFTGRLH